MTLAIQTSAVKKALAKVGKRNGVGMCQYESRKLWGLPSVGDWDGDGSPDAEDAWKAAKRHGRVVEVTSGSKVPAGALVYWSGGANDNWHVATSYAQGKVVSTDWGGTGYWGKADIDTLSRRWNLKLVGYVTHAWNGAKIFEPPAPPPPPGKYSFKKRTVRRGSAGLGHEHHKHDRKGRETYWPKGQGFRVVRKVSKDGLVWGVNPYGNVAPMRNLRKK